MNTKLTLTMDDRIIKKAKTYAGKKHTSLSRLIENYFKLIVRDEPGGEAPTPLVQKLSGVLKIRQGEDMREEYTDYLMRKYR